jgi:D-arginine dehydrogenase
MRSFNFIVIGAGMAGASAAANLAPYGSTVVIERESQPGYHATGRSAALCTACYGGPDIRALTVVSQPFYRSPPAGFADVPLVRPRGAVVIARADQIAELDRHERESRVFVKNLRRLDAAEVARLVPSLRPGYAVAGVLEPDAADIDVAALLQGYLRIVRRCSGEIAHGVTIRSIHRTGGRWEIDAGGEQFAAPTLIDAAGAWSDELAQLAGVAPLGLVPRRRTAVTFDVAEPREIEAWPMVIDAEEAFYFKPDAGRILASPGDETPSPPCDAQPEDYDVALVMDRIGRATLFAPSRLAAKWAGLRTFAPDRMIVAGYDPKVAGFFWLAGHGGYGIQTAPAMGRVVAALVRGEPIPSDLGEAGVTAAALSPDRAGLRRG